MDELEMAFFYGDFSSVRERISKLLYENDEATSTHEEI
jgi:hypothetical protein